MRKTTLFLPWAFCYAFCYPTYYPLKAQEVNYPATTAAGRDAVDSLANIWPKDAPGGVIALIGKGNVIYHRTFGLANVPHQVAVSASTLFNIGSISKQFTGLAFALLAQRKALSLDDSVLEFMPQLPDCFRAVTIRHLLSHTSGLRDAYNMLALAGRIPNKNILHRDDVLNVFARQQELEHPPGSRWEYNSTTYVLLAQILEKVTRQAFPIWIRENIFKPIGMDSTLIETEAEEVIKGAADSYLVTNGNNLVTSFGNRAFYGAGDIYTSIADMAKWGHFWSSHNQDMVVAKNLVQQPYLLTSGENTSYGMGLFVDTYKGLKRIHHGGSHAGYKASFIYFPEIDQGLVVLSNCYPLPSYDLVDAFFDDHFQQDRDEAKATNEVIDAVKEAEWKSDTTLLQRYTGDYFSEEAAVSFKLFVKNGKLVAKDRWGNETKLTRVDEDIFNGEFPFSKIDFIRSGDNKIDGFYLTVNQTSNIWFEGKKD